MKPSNDRRIGLIADVHSNLQALERVFDGLDAADVDVIHCLGDVVGYGGDPAACLSLVRERCEHVVQGNHDRAVAEPALRARFNPHARAAVELQADLLETDDIDWLSELPLDIQLGDLTLGHSGFHSPESYTYVRDVESAQVEFNAMRTPFGAIGHTHVVAVFKQAARGDVSRELGTETTPDARSESREPSMTTVGFRPDDRVIVNPGAVGQPRDRDPRAACAVLDRSAGTVEVIRIPYDVTRAQDAIRRSGMPLFEAGRLAMGL